MRVQFELTTRLAELAGFRDRAIEVTGGDTLTDALHALEDEMDRGGDTLLTSGKLHPSILVVLDGLAQRREENVRLQGGETIRLMLPVAGG